MFADKQALACGGLSVYTKFCTPSSTPVKLNLHPALAWLSLGVEALNDTRAKQAVDDTGANPQITFPDQTEANVLNGKSGLFQTRLGLRQLCRGGFGVSRYLDMNGSCLNHLNLGVEVL